MTCLMTDGYDCYQNALAERINGLLKNELENTEDGAGQVGFQLSNDGTNEIQFGKSNDHSFQHPHEGSNQIPLFIRPRTWKKCLKRANNEPSQNRGYVQLIYLPHLNFGGVAD